LNLTKNSQYVTFFYQIKLNFRYLIWKILYVIFLKILYVIFLNFILVGDFNSHNIIWGSYSSNLRGKLIEKLILNEDLVLLNDSTPTHINIGNSKFSNIDLSLSTPSIAQRLEWEVLPEIYSSDHIPIKIKILPRQVNNKYSNKQRWNLKNPNWNSYTDLLDEETKKILDLTIFDTDKTTQTFTNLITDTAKKTIVTTN